MSPLHSFADNDDREDSGETLNVEISTSNEPSPPPPQSPDGPPPPTDLLSGHIHRRYSPLTDEWVLVSAGRTGRPWQGYVGTPPIEHGLVYDRACYLCPGNTRASGEANPNYRGAYVFTNDYPALRPHSGAIGFDDGLFRAEAAMGTCRVICYSPIHHLSLGALPTGEIRDVVECWADQTAELGERYRWVQVFENRGAAMGASNPHPHGQVWAGTEVPREGVREEAAQRAYLARTGRSLLGDYVSRETDGPRMVEDNEDWAAIVPFWAVWPFETLLLSRRVVSSLPELDGDARGSLADILRRLLTRYDDLFATPFPYSMGWHQAPFGGRSQGHWRLHGHIYPPLLRSAMVRKFMVGYELLSEAQRDLTPEEAADRLRAASPVRTGNLPLG